MRQLQIWSLSILGSAYRRQMAELIGQSGPHFRM